MIFAINSAKLRKLAAHRLLYTAVMRKALAGVLALPLAACVVGDSGTPNTGGPGPGPGSNMGSDMGNPPGGGVAGHISSNTTWSDMVNVTGNVTIDPGVTVTVSPGATVKVGSGWYLDVQGTLAMQGTKASIATIQPDTGASFQGLKIEMGGTVTATYASINGTEIQMNGGTFTAADSKLWGAPGDLLVMNGGTINVTYSNIGDATSDTTHCNMHFGGTTANNVTIEHNNIVARPYGLMFYSGTNADFQNNNWTNQIDIEPGVSGVTGAADGSYFAKGMPSGTTGITYANLATAMLTAGPR
jgi:hypothetical protein